MACIAGRHWQTKEHLVKKNSLVIIKLNPQGGIRFIRHMHKSPRWLVGDEWLFDQALRIGGFRVAGMDAFDGVFVVERADGEFFNSCGMNAVVLPVPVTTEDEDIFDFLLLQPREKRVRLGAETRVVRVVVALAGTVGADHWRG